MSKVSLHVPIITALVVVAIVAVATLYSGCNGGVIFEVGPTGIIFQSEGCKPINVAPTLPRLPTHTTSDNG